ncbi:uncharacterized protein AtWU_06142 [Aspergillus tubingensis]|uniref:uncharacterized protein n=1 Tax=Aspergillus tubingensis TaxID=5068 RepID=UPI001578BB80|nr:uncharacterized protein AtWU_06142 [Aspergillus tubingensis]GFN16341.1 hypothetical protein AtWU_06142 [Aspergillus tubingensis]
MPYLSLAGMISDHLLSSAVFQRTYPMPARVSLPGNDARHHRVKVGANNIRASSPCLLGVFSMAAASHIPPSSYYCSCLGTTSLHHILSLAK